VAATRTTKPSKINRIPDKFFCFQILLIILLFPRPGGLGLSWVKYKISPTSRTGKRVGADIVDYQQNDFLEPRRSALHVGTVQVGFAGAVILGGGWAGRVSLSWSSFSGWV
jgi:hypothetical protein